MSEVAQEEPDEAPDGDEPGDEFPALLKQYPVEEHPIPDNVDREEEEV